MQKTTAAKLGFAAVVTGVSLLVFRHELLAHGAPLVAVQGLAAGLALWARVTYGLRGFRAGAHPTYGCLVTSGPYRLWRHPVYAAIFFFVWAGVASSASAVAVVLGLLVTAGLGARTLAEENLCRQRWPEYAAHAARTKLVIPGLL